jgi:hypothetical protein
MNTHTIDYIAQQIMDLYYQQYKSGEDFFDHVHFRFIAGAVYAKVLQDEYERSYAKSLAERGIGEASLNPEWFIPEEIEVVASDLADYEATLKHPFFAFRFDRQFSGIQDIVPIVGRCKDFIRMSPEQKWQLEMVPDNDVVFWYPVKDKIMFHNVKCGLKRARILYIPSLGDNDEDTPVSATMAEDIVTRSLQIMFLARQGMVVDMTADKNPNKVLESEINQAFQRK